MDWMKVVEQVFELIIYPVLGIAGSYLTYLIHQHSLSKTLMLLCNQNQVLLFV